MNRLELMLIIRILEHIEDRIAREGQPYYTGAKSPWGDLSLPDRLRIPEMLEKAREMLRSVD